ncbi:hypothetical protein ACQ4PT_051980 [Festuca glaucescens]
MAQEGAGDKGKPHAVVVYPLQGHVIPVTHLALRLAARGFAVTVVNTEAVHDQIARVLGVDLAGYDVFADARASTSPETMDVWYELVSDGLPVGFDRSLHHDEFMARCSTPSPGTSRRCSAASSWTRPRRASSRTLSSCGRPRWPGSSASQPRKDTITYIPGVPAIEPHELMSYLQETDITSVVHRIIFKAFEEARGADYVLCNTVEELEPSTITALRAEKPFYAVGPIFPAGFARSAVATSMWAESDCSSWLDAQPAGSVLYISFGSYAHVTKQELHEIAGGVLVSGARFLWVMRPDIVSSDDPDPLPEGFAAASAGRGLVVPWCCQVEVLSHEAVGGFLTHCGWKSMLESVWAGVPMLCFPLLTDQFTNHRLVVREWRVGVSIGDRGAVFTDEVRARIEGVMSGKEGEELQQAVKKVRATLEAAAAPSGSSQRSFDEFVDELTRRCGGR